MTQPQATDFPKPSLLRRLAAILYDTILIGALLMLLALLWLLVVETIANISSLDLKASTSTAIQIIFVALTAGFFIYFWSQGGQTLGMTTWRIRLRHLDGSVLSLNPILIRLTAACLSIACLGLGYLWMLIDKDKLTWHDRISKTGLELLAKKEK